MTPPKIVGEFTGSFRRELLLKSSQLPTASANRFHLTCSVAQSLIHVRKLLMAQSNSRQNEKKLEFPLTHDIHELCVVFLCFLIKLEHTNDTQMYTKINKRQTAKIPVETRFLFGALLVVSTSPKHFFSPFRLVVFFGFVVSVHRIAHVVPFFLAREEVESTHDPRV